jgi:hypothetical protein
VTREIHCNDTWALVTAVMGTYLLRAHVGAHCMMSFVGAVEITNTYVSESG